LNDSATVALEVYGEEQAQWTAERAWLEQLEEDGEDG
jgi:hypothetical protein